MSRVSPLQIETMAVLEALKMSTNIGIQGPVIILSDCKILVTIVNQTNENYTCDWQAFREMWKIWKFL
jgi:ribonuclease HI